MTDNTSPVVVVRTDNNGNTAASWYPDLDAAHYPGNAALVATPAGVTVAGYLTDIPAGWVEAARRAHDQLKTDPAADLGRLATHYHDGPSNGPLKPVTAGKQG